MGKDADKRKKNRRRNQSKAKAKAKAKRKKKNKEKSSDGKAKAKGKGKGKGKGKSSKGASTGPPADLQTAPLDPGAIDATNVSSNWKRLLAANKVEGAGHRRRGSAKRQHSEEDPVADKPPRKIRKGASVGDDMTATEPVPLVDEDGPDGLTDYVAMDCEMVGVGEGGVRSILARVSIVNYYGHTLIDEFVHPKEFVTDFRTRVSGVRWEDISHAPEFEEVQARVAEILDGRILVGHAVHHDLEALLLNHPKPRIRDTAKYKPLRKKGGRPRALRDLSSHYLGLKIQAGEHSSVVDAQATMAVFKKFQGPWEAAIAARARRSKRQNKNKKRNKPQRGDAGRREAPVLSGEGSFEPSLSWS